MTHSIVLLNDGTSAVLLNDGTSQVLLNTEGEAHVTGSGGGLAGKLRRTLKRAPPQQLQEVTLYEEMFRAKPVKIMTNEVSLKGIPLLRQYVLRLMDITLKPVTTTNEIISKVTLNPINRKEVHFGVRSFPFTIIKSILSSMKFRPVLGDYSTTDFKARSLDGINIIKAAMALDNVRSFEFRESAQNWESADTLSDLEQRIKVLDDRIDTLQRQVDPREKVFDHPSSFVGQVTYTPEFNTMEITLNGQVYGFCGVPERIFEAFEAAPSKGGYFARSIKGQFNC